MDPVGPWSAYAASYNRLAGATGGFQAGTGSGTGEFVTSHHHLSATGNTGIGSHQPPGGGVPSTTSQLLLQAAHTTASLAGQLGMSAAGPGSTPSPFTPGSFLSPSSVSYDAVFSPLFHHANPKPAHYGSSLNVSQHRQVLAQAQAAVTKQNSGETDLPSLRESYSTTHHQNIAPGSFFEHQTSPPPSSLAWSHQGNAQLPSPFGILPHETVVTSSPGPTKSSTLSYENSFNAHFAAAQSLNHLNSQIPTPSEFSKSASYIDNSKKIPRSQSPIVTSTKATVSSVSAGSSFFNQSSPNSSYVNSDSLSSRGDCATLTGNFSSNKSQITTGSEFNSSSKNYSSSSSSQQQSCIVPITSSNVTSKDYRIPQPPRSSNTSVFLNSATATSNRSSTATEKQSSRGQNFAPPTTKASVHHIQTKAQTKVYPDISVHPDHSHHSESVLESSQSSPISFVIMDASTHRQNLNYSNTNNSVCGNGSSTKLSSSSQHNTSSNLQQNPQFHLLSQPAAAAAAAAVASATAAVAAAATNSSYQSRHYAGASSVEGDYHPGNRGGKAPSTDSSYSDRLLPSSSTVVQNGPDCSVVVPRRPSPLQAHSQASPLSHVPSPAYPLYNSPMTSMSSPSPLQQHTETAVNQCSNGLTRTLDTNNPSSQQMTPPSPLDVSVSRPPSQGNQVAYSSVITRALSSGETNKTYTNETHAFERSQHPQHQEFSQKQQNCWDSEDGQSHHSRTAKFGNNSTNYNTSAMEITQLAVQPQASQARTGLSVAERQQGFFDTNPSHQVTLQDLSSCRGDPMSIVKNLQTLQQQQHQQQQSSCQLQQTNIPSDQLKSPAEERSIITKSNSSSSNGTGSTNIKRRKSGEKSHSNPSAAAIVSDTSSVIPEYYAGRVPPPAHHNTHSGNQSQNGSYFEYERWNLPPPPPKMFTSGPGAFSTQSTIHHGANFLNNPHQHQSLMVPHPHHATPPLPYFSPFPLHPSGHHAAPPSAHDYQSPVDVASSSFENQSSSDAGGEVPLENKEPPEEQPKVIVPNIEEELEFLSEISIPTTCSSSGSSTLVNTSLKTPEKKPFSYSNPSSGFMASYLKFLQGERDSSPPPPQTRGGRKASWSKTKLYQPTDPSKQPSTPVTNSSISVTTSTSVTTLSAAAVKSAAVSTTTPTMPADTIITTTVNSTAIATSNTAAAATTTSIPSMTITTAAITTVCVSASTVSNKITNTDACTTQNSVSNTSKTGSSTKTTNSPMASSIVSEKIAAVLKPKETQPAYDPQDDPRYFPLPKPEERKNSFTDSDDDFSDNKKKIKIEKEEEDNEKEEEKYIIKEMPKEKDKKDKEKGKKSPKARSKSPPKATVKIPKLHIKSPTKLKIKTSQLENSDSNNSVDSSSSKSNIKISQDVAQTPEVVATKLTETTEKIDKADKGKKTQTARSGVKRKHEAIEEPPPPPPPPPRRETCRRKAKEKTNMKFLDRQDDEFDVDEPEFGDSDSDPAWTPATKDSSDDDAHSRRRVTRRSVLGNRRKTRLVSSEKLEEDCFSSNDSQDTPASENTRTRSRQNRSSNRRGRPSASASAPAPIPIPVPTPIPVPASVSASASVSAAVSASAVSTPKTQAASPEPKSSIVPTIANKVTHSDSDMPFRSGEFVVIKSDLSEEYPPIWRIDGKTLLQKYEPFTENGKTLYRNISTYSGWTPTNKHIYQQVPIRFKVQNRVSTVVEFLRDELDQGFQNVLDASMKETAKYQDNFEVYIQTLISQALDSNFLTEILQEKDEYFLSNVKTVDDVTEERKRKLLEVAKWKPGLQFSIGTWPCFNIISDLPADEKQGKLCTACDKLKVSLRVQMYGQPYNSTTLEGCQPDPKVASEKDFLVCDTCVTHIELYNKVAHQKYLMYIECAKRVAEKRGGDLNKDTTVILNELLTDEAWLNQLFHSVRTLWAEIDKLTHSVEHTVT